MKQVTQQAITKEQMHGTKKFFSTFTVINHYPNV